VTGQQVQWDEGSDEGIPGHVRTVWQDGPEEAGIQLATCPVLHVTSEAKEVLGWFDRTHELSAIGNAVWWRLNLLPSAGGLDDQDARLMASLSVVRSMENDVLHEHREPTQGEPRQRPRRRRRG
jgi:hypothetical protein